MSLVKGQYASIRRNPATQGALISSVLSLSDEDFARISPDKSGAGARSAGGVGGDAEVALLGDDEMLVSKEI